MLASTMSTCDVSASFLPKSDRDDVSNIGQYDVGSEASLRCFTLGGGLHGHVSSEMVRLPNAMPIVNLKSQRGQTNYCQTNCVGK